MQEGLTVLAAVFSCLFLYLNYDFAQRRLTLDTFHNYKIYILHNVMHHIVGVKRKVTRYIFKMYRKTNIIPLYTGRFIMFSVITNIYNKKTKEPTIMELFRATRKLNIFFDN